ncbi:MAG: hypothetical protein PHE53_06310 [Thermoguttaceae bacterium]|nr:hypothetical protein [Thermoguttaceae bacterium]
MGTRELPNLHRSWLLNEIAFWKEQGVLSEGQDLRLLTLYDEYAVQGMPSRNLAGWMLSAIASLLVIVIAYILFFSFHDQMSIATQTFWVAGFLIILGCGGIVLRFIGRYGRFVSSDLLLTATCASFWIAMPVLLSAISPHGMPNISLSFSWWWYPMSAVLFALCSRVTATPLLLSVALAGWMVFAASWPGHMPVGKPMPGLFWTTPVCILLLFYWAWRRRSPFILGVVILLTLEMCLWCLVRYNEFRPETLRVSLAIMSSALLLGIYGIFSTLGSKRQYFFSLFVIGITIAGISLIWAGSEAAAQLLRQETDDVQLMNTGLIIWIVAFSIVVLCVAMSKGLFILWNRSKRPDLTTDAENATVQSSLPPAVFIRWGNPIILLITCCLTFPQTNPFRLWLGMETVSIASMVVINIGTLLVVVTCVGYSFYAGRMEYFVAGTLLFVIWIIVRYVEYFSILQERYGVWGSVVFLLCCALFVLILRFVWKSRPPLATRRDSTALAMDEIHAESTESSDTMRIEKESVPNRFIFSPPLTLSGLINQFEYCEAPDKRFRWLCLIAMSCGLLLQIVLLFLLVTTFGDVPWKESIPSVLTSWIRP